MRKLNSGWQGWLGVAVLGGLLAGCGGRPRTTVSGVAQASGPVAGTVALVDSSAVPQRRTAAVGAGGAFTIDAAGLTPPFLLKVESQGSAGTTRLFSATDDGQGADVNPITSAAFTGAAGGTGDEAGDDDAFEHQGGDEHHATAGKVGQLLGELRTALAPLFQRYGVADPTVDQAAVQLLLADVSFRVEHGVLTVTNRQSGAVIFTGPLSDLASGTFHPEAMPAGPGTPPPPAPGACSYTYDAWSACAGGLQTRAVVSATPAGCTGTPLLTQACTATPPPIDGAALYTTYCAGCHGNAKKGQPASLIAAAIANGTGGMGSAALRALTPAQIAAIAAAP